MPRMQEAKRKGMSTPHSEITIGSANITLSISLVRIVGRTESATVAKSRSLR